MEIVKWSGAASTHAHAQDGVVVRRGRVLAAKLDIRVERNVHEPETREQCLVDSKERALPTLASVLAVRVTCSSHPTRRFKYRPV